MREIIFRGKRLDNGEWVYGWPFADTADCSLKKVGKCECPHDGSEYFIVEWADDLHEYKERKVIPDTVGQYTGMKDKNGKRIFEGDIVLGLFHYELAAKGVVTFRDGAFGLRWNRGKVREFSAFTSICNVAYEVIGNIHDNPELLEGGRE